MTPAGARCSVHGEVPAAGTCARCGRFACSACLVDAVCAECAARVYPAASGLALAAFILSVTNFVVGGLACSAGVWQVGATTSVTCLVVGIVEHVRIARGRASVTGRGYATLALLCGGFGLIFPLMIVLGRPLHLYVH